MNLHSWHTLRWLDCRWNRQPAGGRQQQLLASRKASQTLPGTAQAMAPMHMLLHALMARGTLTRTSRPGRSHAAGLRPSLISSGRV